MSQSRSVFARSALLATTFLGGALVALPATAQEAPPEDTTPLVWTGPNETRGSLPFAIYARGDGTWDSTRTNWNDGTDPVAWDGGYARFINGGVDQDAQYLRATVTVSGLQSISRMEVQNYIFSGSGGLAINGPSLIVESIPHTGRMIGTDFNVPVSGDGMLIKRGSTPLRLYATSSYAGGTRVEAGELQAWTVNALGAGAITVTGDSAVLQFIDNAGLSTNNDFTIEAGGRLDITSMTTGSTLVIGSLSGNGRISLGGQDLEIVGSGNHVFSGSIRDDGVAGGELRLQNAGTMTLSGDSTFTGDTRVFAERTLLVDGSLAGGVIAYGAVGGAGRIGGGLRFVADSGQLNRLVGAAGRTLTVDRFLELTDTTDVNVTLDAPGTPALFNVTGDLTLDGRLNVTAGEGFADGAYRLFDYSGALTDNGLVITTVPTGYNPGDFALDTVSGQVNLIVPQSGSGANEQFWDGMSAAPGNVAGGRGGTGIWDGSATNWTNAAGNINSTWAGGTAVFNFPTASPNPYTVTLSGQQSFTGLRFGPEGSRQHVATLVAGSGGGLTIAGDAATIDVQQNSADGTLISIAAPISGSGGLVKIGVGSLSLTGNNSYAGGTIIREGALSIAKTASTTGTIGTGPVTVEGGNQNFDGGSLAFGNGITIGAITLTNNNVVAGPSRNRSANGIEFLGGSSAGAAEIVNNGGVIRFGSGDADTSGPGGSAGSATITNTGTIFFGTRSSADNATILNNSGGVVNVSGRNAGGQSESSELNIGSLSGVGNVALGNESLALGNLDRNDVIGGVISGDEQSQLIKTGSGRLTLTGANTYTGFTTVREGTLDIEGSIVGNVGVYGGALGGSGTIGGSVSITDTGALAGGSSGGPLRFNSSLSLSDASAINVTLGALDQSSVMFSVAGDLTLDGRLNVTTETGFGRAGTYALFDYGGVLTNNGLVISTVPTGSNPGDWSIDTATAGRVGLIVPEVGTGPGEQYWDGANATPGNVANGRGGSGTWDTTTTNWTNAAGTINAPWAGGTAVFNGGTGDTARYIVTIDPAGLSAAGLRMIGGQIYTIRGGDLTLAPGAVIDVRTDDLGSGDLNRFLNLEGPAITAQGDLTVHGGGQVSTLGEVDVAGALTVENGSLGIAFSNASASLDPVAVRAGTLIIGTNATGDPVRTSGSLRISRYASLNSNGAVLGRDANAFGSLFIGGNWDAGTADIVVGDAGDGALTVSSDGDVATAQSAIGGRLIVARQAGSRSSFTVRSSDTLVRTQGALIGVAAGSEGRVVLGSGATWDAGANEIVLGQAGRGELSISGEATLIASVIRAADQAGSTASIGLGSGRVELPDGFIIEATDGRIEGDVIVAAGTAEIGGRGTITGAVHLTGLSTLTGRTGDRLTMGSLVLSDLTNVSVTLGAPSETTLFAVMGDLTLDGRLNVTAGADYGQGVYRLFDYGGALTDNGLTIASLPTGSQGSLQTSIAKQVNLVVGGAGAGPLPEVQFWNGGTGTWGGPATNWTDANGTRADAWGGKFAVFQGTGVTVTVDAAGIDTTGMQFASNGYGLEGGTITLDAPATLRVGDGSQVGASFSATIANVITGSGGLEKTDLGTLILGGANSYTGPTRVTGGTLRVNGSVAGAVTVGSGATLGGTGRVGDLTVSSGATVSPGNSIGTLTIAGNFVQSAGSTYHVEINPAGESDRLDVAGTATLEGGTVYVEKVAGTYLPGTRFTILNAAGGINGTYASLDQNMPFVNLALAYEANTVFLDVARNNIAFCAVASTRNQCASGNGVESMGSGTIYDAVVSLPDDGAARTAFTALSGEIYATARGVMLADARLARDAMLSRTSDGAVGTGLWGEVIGQWGDGDGDGNATGYDRSSVGLLAGIDAMAGEDWRLGVAGGYSRTTLDLDGRADHGRLQGIHVLGYAAGALGPVRVRVGAGYTDFDLKARRTITFEGFSDGTRAKVGGSVLQSFAEVGYAIPAGTGEAEPFAGLAAARVSTDGFAETGGPARLSGTGSKDSTLFSTLGMRVNFGAEDFRIHGSAAWRHAFGDIVPTSRLAFDGGTSVTFGGVPINRDEAAIDIGAAWRLTPAVTLGVRYSGIIGANGQDHGGRATLSVAF